MLGELAIRRVDLGLVAIRGLDRRAKIVGHGDRTDAGEVLVHPYVAVEPGRQILRERRPREGVGTRAQRADEQLRADALAGVFIEQRQAVAEVHEALLASAVWLSQHHRQALLEASIQLGELRVLVAVRVLALVLLPQQRERHLVIGAGQLLAHLRPVRQRPGRRALGRDPDRRIQSPRQLDLIESGNARPVVEIRHPRAA